MLWLNKIAKLINIMSKYKEELNQKESPIIKGSGVNESERYLNKLCQNTFLSLWSYPCLYKNQGSGRASGGSKELCDLIVFFEKHIIIFSDKNCVFPDSGDIEVDWNRWFRSAVEKGADQIYGAESWIKQYPDRIFLDRECAQKFPLKIPDPTEAIFHRIAVAHGASKRCKEALGGSGSLELDPSIISNAHYMTFDEGKPFAIGQINPNKGYVHVFDEITLDIILNTLDTISDFTEYLLKKERLIQNEKLGIVKGEENLLAYYLKNYDSEGYLHEFVIPKGVEKLQISQKEWEHFNSSEQRKSQIKANEISYSWDKLIEKFNYHILNRTQYHTIHDPVKAGVDACIWFLARENRTRRRILAFNINDLISRTPINHKAVRLLTPSHVDESYYVFLLLPKPKNYKKISYADMRNIRLQMLQDYCAVVRYLYPKAQDIVGIATESHKDAGRSEDAVYFDGRSWTEEDAKHAKCCYEEYGYLRETSMFKGKVSEYPKPNDGVYYYSPAPKPRPAPRQAIRLEPKNPRNLPCPCGSGKKWKKCHAHQK